MIEAMPLTVTTDPAQIASLLEQQLAADPVRATVLGSIVADVRDGRTTEAWCATRVGADALVVRSARAYPALFTSGWDGADLVRAIDHVRDLPDLIGLSGPVQVVDVAAAALADRHALHRMGLRLFRLDELRTPSGVPGEARAATAADRGLIIDWYRAFHAEAGGFGGHLEEAADRALSSGQVWLWHDDGGPVSLAARRAPEAGSARVGPVYTPPQHRGRGYGSAVTAAATRDVLDRGAIPVLFTDLANPTSNKIYQQLGYYAVEDRVQITFGVIRSL
jgi:predicted GNAT family acetyltransferase